jgi:ABC-type uncharacterized transport system YnjBCD substrate-binding protein
MDITVTQELRQATDWLANGKFAICFFCSEVLKAKFQGLPVDEFPAVRWKESRAISAGNVGSLALPSQPPHPHAARLFVNWLLSREGQTAFQRAANTPTNSEESMRIDIPKEMIPAFFPQPIRGRSVERRLFSRFRLRLYSIRSKRRIDGSAISTSHH